MHGVDACSVNCAVPVRFSRRAIGCGPPKNPRTLASIRARLAEIHQAADDSPMQTREQWAALEFDPVSPEIAEPFENPDWDEECSELGVVGRMAACCCKTPEGRADWLVPHPAVAALVPVLKARHYFTN